MQAISNILRAKDQFAMAIDYLRAILKIEGNNGEVWGSLGTFARLQSLPNNKLISACEQVTAI